MSYELYSSGKKPPEKMDIICPECSTKGEVLWTPAFSNTYTGGVTKRVNYRSEKVEGTCKKCGYKFKPDDLD